MTLAIHPTAPLGAILALGGTLLVLVTRQGTVAGAIAGFLVALLAVLGLGAGSFLPLSIFVLGSGLLTRLGRAGKERIGAAEGNRGRRGIGHVAAKLSGPALAGALALLGLASGSMMALVFAAAIAGAFADTAATELGPILGGPAFVLRAGGLAPAPHGTTGAMSAGGFGASALGALAVALGGFATGLLDARAAGIAALAGFTAATLESLLAGTPLGSRAGHFGRNVFLSLASAGLALGARAFGWTP